jgi:dihydrofolate reductase
MIAAIGKNNELGKSNTLLWDLPCDMKHFRDTTRGKTVVMGQKTFESLGRPLPNRRNIVLTRNENFTHEGIEVVCGIDELFGLLERTAQADEEIFIIGGGQIYTLFIDKADKLYITHVDMETEADAFFPAIDMTVWKKVSEDHHTADEFNKYPHNFTIYEKS